MIAGESERLLQSANLIIKLFNKFNYLKNFSIIG